MDKTFLSGCKTRFLSLIENLKLKMFENKVWGTIWTWEGGSDRKLEENCVLR
jgi:hypothetical protein